MSTASTAAHLKRTPKKSEYKLEIKKTNCIWKRFFFCEPLQQQYPIGPRLASNAPQKKCQNKEGRIKRRSFSFLFRLLFVLFFFLFFPATISWLVFSRKTRSTRRAEHEANVYSSIYQCSLNITCNIYTGIVYLGWVVSCSTDWQRKIVPKFFFFSFFSVFFVENRSIYPSAEQWKRKEISTAFLNHICIDYY